MKLNRRFLIVPFAQIILQQVPNLPPEARGGPGPTWVQLIGGILIFIVALIVIGGGAMAIIGGVLYVVMAILGGIYKGVRYLFRLR